MRSAQIIAFPGCKAPEPRREVLTRKDALDSVSDNTKRSGFLIDIGKFANIIALAVSLDELAEHIEGNDKAASAHRIAMRALARLEAPAYA